MKDFTEEEIKKYRRFLKNAENNMKINQHNFPLKKPILSKKVNIFFASILIALNGSFFISKYKLNNKNKQ